MKSFKFLTLILSTATFLGLQAMAPYYGELNHRPPLSLEQRSRSVTPTLVPSPESERLFLTDEELRQKKLACYSDSECEDEAQEAARFLAAYTRNKARLECIFENNENSKPEKETTKKTEAEGRVVIKNTTKSLLEDPLDHADRVSSFLFLNKKRNQTTSPLSQWLVEGKESLFSEPTSPSVSTKKEESDSETETDINAPSDHGDVFFPLE